MDTYKLPVPRIAAMAAFWAKPTRSGFSSQNGRSRSTRSVATFSETNVPYQALTLMQVPGVEGIHVLIMGWQLYKNAKAPMSV